jgi:hypothetical protein
LAFTVILTPTGEAFTHTHVKFGIDLGFLICKGEIRRRKKITYMIFTPHWENHKILLDPST